jgi:hypothetical protein
LGWNIRGGKKLEAELLNGDGATRGTYRNNILAGRSRIRTTKLLLINHSFDNYLLTILMPTSYFPEIPMVTSTDG